MKQYIVLSGLGPDRPGIARAIGQAAFEAGCSIEDSRMAVLGGEFAILVLLEGEERELEAFRHRLVALEQETGLALNARPTRERPSYQVEKGLPYYLTVVGMDRTGIVFRVTELLARHGVNIANLETEAYNAPVAGTPMFRMVIAAEVPASFPLRQLREELAALCDELNLDYGLEAQG